MFDGAYRIMASIQEVARGVSALRNGLIRIGEVDSVDSAAGTVVVRFPDRLDDTGAPVLSPPFPWLQRSTEHRPPTSGDHALVIDPSLGNGGAIVIAGWSSVNAPPAAGGGDVDVIYQERGGAAQDIYAGADRTIVAGDVLVDADAVALDAPDIELGVSPTDYPALASRVDQLWSALHSAFAAWAPAPMDGGAGLKAAFTASFPAPPQSVAASQVKVK